MRLWLVATMAHILAFAYDPSQTLSVEESSAFCTIIARFLTPPTVCSNSVPSTSPCVSDGIECQSIDGLNRIVGLDFMEQSLGGTVDWAALAQLSRLAFLDLSQSNLGGTIGSEIGLLSALTYLDLSYNAMWGSVPTQLARLSLLTLAAFDSNALSGSLPEELCSLPLWPVPQRFLFDNNAGLCDRLPSCLSSMGTPFTRGTGIGQGVCDISPPSCVAGVLNCTIVAPRFTVGLEGLVVSLPRFEVLSNNSGNLTYTWEMRDESGGVSIPATGLEPPPATQDSVSHFLFRPTTAVSSRISLVSGVSYTLSLSVFNGEAATPTVARVESSPITVDNSPPLPPSFVGLQADCPPQSTAFSQQSTSASNFCLTLCWSAFLEPESAVESHFVRFFSLPTGALPLDRGVVNPAIVQGAIIAALQDSASNGTALDINTPLSDAGGSIIHPLSDWFAVGPSNDSIGVCFSKDSIPRGKLLFFEIQAINSVLLVGRAVSPATEIELPQEASLFIPLLIAGLVLLVCLAISCKFHRTFRKPAVFQGLILPQGQDLVRTTLNTTTLTATAPQPHVPQAFSSPFRAHGPAETPTVANHVSVRQATSLAFVFTDLEGSTAMSQADPPTFERIQRVHDSVVREVISSTRGYEIATQGDAFELAFLSVAEAVDFCLTVQRRLLETKWLRQVHSMPHCARLVRPGDNRLVFNGPRVRMGIHFATSPDFIRKEHMFTQITVFTGPAYELTAKVGDLAHGGQVLMTQAAVTELFAGSGFRQAGFPCVLSLGEFNVDCPQSGPEWHDVGRIVHLYQVNPPIFASMPPRVFPDLPATRLSRPSGFNITPEPPLALRHPKALPPREVAPFASEFCESGHVALVVLRLTTVRQSSLVAMHSELSNISSLRMRTMRGSKISFLHSSTLTGQPREESTFADRPQSILGMFHHITVAVAQLFRGFLLNPDLPPSLSPPYTRIVFPSANLALQFCIAAQVHYVYASWDKKEAVHFGESVRTLDGAGYLFRGPRVAMSIHTGNIKQCLMTRPQQAQSFCRCRALDGSGSPTLPPPLSELSPARPYKLGPTPSRILLEGGKPEAPERQKSGSGSAGMSDPMPQRLRRSLKLHLNDPNVGTSSPPSLAASYSDFTSLAYGEDPEPMASPVSRATPTSRLTQTLQRFKSRRGLKRCVDCGLEVQISASILSTFSVSSSKHMPRRTATSVSMHEHETNETARSPQPPTTPTSAVVPSRSHTDGTWDYKGELFDTGQAIVQAAHGGQVVLSEDAWRACSVQLPAQTEVQHLGIHRLLLHSNTAAEIEAKEDVNVTPHTHVSLAPGAATDEQARTNRRYTLSSINSVGSSWQGEEFPILDVPTTEPMSLMAVAPLCLSGREFPPLESAVCVLNGYQDAPAPDAGVAIMFCDVATPQSVFPTKESFLEAVSAWAELVRQTLPEFGGYECKEPYPGKFTLAFQDPVNAIRFGCAVQLRLLEVDWSEEVLDILECAPKTTPSLYADRVNRSRVLRKSRSGAGIGRDSESSIGIQSSASFEHASQGSTHEGSSEEARLLWKGLSVRIGMAYGSETFKKPLQATGRADYFGPLPNLAARVLGQAAPGQFLYEGDNVELDVDWVDGLGMLDTTPTIHLKKIAFCTLKGIETPRLMVQAAFGPLMARRFPRPKGATLSPQLTGSLKRQSLIRKMGAALPLQSFSPHALARKAKTSAFSSRSQAHFTDVRLNFSKSDPVDRSSESPIPIPLPLPEGTKGDTLEMVRLSPRTAPHT